MPEKTTGRDGGDRSTRKDYKHTANRSTTPGTAKDPCRLTPGAGSHGERASCMPVICHHWRHRP
jgi:hypothetical protein